MKVKYVVVACAALILVPLAVAHVVLRASLPELDGEVHHMGVVSAVTIDRDELGVPTVEAANRVDLAYGTGFVHGQDRFFEMDLSRRLAAGELSEVFGQVAVEQDRKARLFRFRQVAREVLQQGTPEQRAVLEAYARGVNAGLASLRSRPWEYWLFRSVPADWRPGRVARRRYTHCRLYMEFQQADIPARPDHGNTGRDALPRQYYFGRAAVPQITLMHATTVCGDMLYLLQRMSHPTVGWPLVLPHLVWQPIPALHYPSSHGRPAGTRPNV